MEIAEYDQQEAYILGIPKFTKKNTPENTKKLLGLLQLKSMDEKIIHVAGTNGKGSVCNYLRELLLADGYHVGMFISPHLVTMRERIVCDDAMVSREEFSAAFQTVYDTWQLHRDELPHPTFFEFLFLMAMVIFDRRSPDYIILETGLGGRLDATNVLEKKVMTVITEIGLDHCQYLGDTVEQIALEKAGILREKTPLVTLSKKASVAKVLEKEAEKRGTIVTFVNKNVICVKNISNKSIDFSYYSIYYNNIDLTIMTLALYQLENVSLALRAHELLIPKEKMQPEGVRMALQKAHWPARMEEICPGIFLDGAHNEDGIEAFLESAARMSAGKRSKLLFSASNDKNYEEMIKRLAESGLFSAFYTTGMGNSRTLETKAIAELFRRYTDKAVYEFDCVSQALKVAKQQKNENELLYVVGSLYLAGEVRSRFGEED